MKLKKSYNYIKELFTNRTHLGIFTRSLCHFFPFFVTTCRLSNLIDRCDEYMYMDFYIKLLLFYFIKRTIIEKKVKVQIVTLYMIK